ncbi:MAG: hypothetical protein Q4D02_05340 [Clostridia bacterium]|nr:hypothetical protein [Clostridia bacterium]
MKKGISMMMLVVATSVMMIIITSASVIGMNSINTANFEEYRSVLSRVEDDVNYYYVENDSLPIQFDEEGIMVVDPSSINSELYNQVIEMGDENNDLYVIDTAKLNDNTIYFSNQDVFLVASNSHNIYSLNGFKYKSKVYYKI